MSYALVTRGVLAAAVLISLGCSREEVDQTTGGTASDAQQTANGTGEAGQASAAEAGTQAVVPLHLAEMIARVDLRTLPMMEGNSRNSSSITTYGFTLPDSSGKTEGDVLTFLDQALTERGCQRFKCKEFDSIDTEFPPRLYAHGDLLLQVSCGATKGFMGKDLNAFVGLVGNFDVRAVPVPADTVRKSASPVSAELESQQEILPLRKSYAEIMSKLGWHAYRDHIPGAEISVEDQLPFQYFIRNGVKLFLYYRVADAATKPIKTMVNMNVSVVEYEPVFPPDARSLELRFDPPATLFETALSPEEVKTFLTEALKPHGYTFAGDEKTSEEGWLTFNFSHEKRPGLQTESNVVGKSTMVLINQQPSK